MTIQKFMKKYNIAVFVKIDNNRNMEIIRCSFSRKMSKIYTQNVKNQPKKFTERKNYLNSDIKNASKRVLKRSL